jgi:hypothetical protein
MPLSCFPSKIREALEKEEKQFETALKSIVPIELTIRSSRKYI